MSGALTLSLFRLLSTELAPAELNGQFTEQGAEWLLDAPSNVLLRLESAAVDFHLVARDGRTEIGGVVERRTTYFFGRDPAS